MANLINWITEAAGGETVEAIVVGKKGWTNNDPVPIFGKVVSWEIAKPLLDYEFNDGYGSPQCHAITVWTETKVIFVDQYDGATNIRWIPRNPIDHDPIMPGG